MNSQPPARLSIVLYLLSYFLHQFLTIFFYSVSMKKSVGLMYLSDPNYHFFFLLKEENHDTSI